MKKAGFTFPMFFISLVALNLIVFWVYPNISSAGILPQVFIFAVTLEASVCLPFWMIEAHEVCRKQLRRISWRINWLNPFVYALVVLPMAYLMSAFCNQQYDVFEWPVRDIALFVVAAILSYFTIVVIVAPSSNHQNQDSDIYDVSDMD